MFQEIRTKAFNIMLIVAVAIVAWAMAFHVDWVLAGLPKTNAQRHAISQLCAGHEASGKCADPCPVPAEANEIYCRMEPTGCAFADAIPADSPKCVEPEAAVYNDNQPASAAYFSGK